MAVLIWIVNRCSAQSPAFRHGVKLSDFDLDLDFDLD
jgi:hypothetical protein